MNFTFSIYFNKNNQLCQKIGNFFHLGGIYCIRIRANKRCSEVFYPVLNQGRINSELFNKLSNSFINFGGTISQQYPVTVEIK